MLQASSAIGELQFKWFVAFSGQLQVNDNLIFLIFSFYFTHTGLEVMLAPLCIVGPKNYEFKCTPGIV